MALPPIKFPSLKNSEDTPKAVLKTNVQGFSSLESNLSDIKEILQKQFEFNVDWQRKQNLADIEKRRESLSKGTKIASGTGTGAIVSTGGNTDDSGGNTDDSGGNTDDSGGKGGGGGSTVAGAAAGFGLAGLASTLKGALPLLSRGVAVLSGAKMVADGYAGVKTADKDGQSKTSSAIGNAIGGGKGGIANAITQGIMGATLGFKAFGPVGAILGGGGGLAAGAIGGEKITDALDDFQSEVAGIFGKTLEISPGRKQSIEKRIEESGKHQETALKEIESLTKTIEDTANVSLEDRKAALEKRKDLEDALRESQENVARDKDILARDEMAVLDKQIEAMKKKKDFTMEDQLQVEKLEKEKEKIRNSFDYQEDISDKIGEVGSNIGKSFMEMVDGIGSLFGKNGPGRGQFSRRNNKKAPQVAMDALDPKKTLAMHEEYNSAISGPPPMLSGSTESASLDPNYEVETEGTNTGEITGFTSKQAAAMNALPMKGNEITGYSMMQSNRLRNRRPVSDSGTGEITGFTSKQWAASQASMNALPMKGNEITGFSTNQSNMMRRQDMMNRRPVSDSGTVLQSDGNMRGTKSLSYNKGTLGEDNDLMQNFGKGTPAVLHGNEAVLNEEQLANLARGIPLAAETLLKKIRPPSAEGIEANEMMSKMMGGENMPSAGNLSQDVIKKIDDIEPNENGNRRLTNEDGTTYSKDRKGRYRFSGGFGTYLYSPDGKLLSYETPNMLGISLKKDMETGNVTQTFRGKMEDGMSVRRSKTFDESGAAVSGSMSATMGGINFSSDSSGILKATYRSEKGTFSKEKQQDFQDMVKGLKEQLGIDNDAITTSVHDNRLVAKTQLTGAALEAMQKEMLSTPMTPTNVVAPTDNSTVNNVVNNNSTIAPKPQARNQEPSSARYGGMMAGAY